jgi:hypothetical protein
LFPPEPFANNSNVSLPYTVTSVKTSIDANSVTANCNTGHTFVFTANITSNGPGPVTYFWERSDGSQTPEATLNFSQAGTLAVTDNWNPDGLGGVTPLPYEGWDRIYIDQPNRQYFDAQYFTLTCK